MALPPDQNLVSVLLATFFVALKLPSHTFVPPAFHHLILEPSSLGFLLSHVPKYQIFLKYLSLLSSHDPTQSYKHHLFSLYILQFAIGFSVALLTTAFSYPSSDSCKKHRYRLKSLEKNPSQESFKKAMMMQSQH